MKDIEEIKPTDRTKLYGIIPYRFSDNPYNKKHKKLNSNQLRILHFVYFADNLPAGCQFTNDQIGEDLEISAICVSICVKKLKEYGFIRVSNGDSFLRRLKPTKMTKNIFNWNNENEGF